MLQEHWFWPIQLHQLDSIDKNYCHTAVCDKRLSPTSDLIRGCGGTAIFWKRCLNATLLSNLNSDRICGVQLPLPQSCTLTILGVYMPSSYQPQVVYSSYVDIMDQTISQISPTSPLVVVGDLNCHMGYLGSPRSPDCPNARGSQWAELIDHHSLYVPTLSNISNTHLSQW